MAPIDRLDGGTRSLVRVASVIGRNFFYRVLNEVASYIEEIDRRLDYLKEIQLIRERKRMEEIEYLFKHALTQEAAYESILIQRKKDIDHRKAQSIEKIFNERLHEFYGMLAYHYSRAESLDNPQVVPLRNDLYTQEWRLFHNFFLPSVKLLAKERIASKTIRRYDPPKTPYQRVMESPLVTPATKRELTAQLKTLNPFS